eukprot:TRINITY_DN3254_c0_g1_i3.p1 TRINITY_DN3254_c0_g1~~TRINITY_DN3254_c0_g1_i3.p1  ORF type:complete len:458 (-),score=124.33 TRINITY_DN3254_c0_g1_i3:72-1445(-)
MSALFAKMATAEQLKAALPTAEKFVDFLNGSVTQYHAVDNVKKHLDAAGFVRYSEKSDWKDLKPLTFGYFTRNQSTVVAFAVGGQYKSGNGFNIVGAHTDSPNLVVKPTYSVDANGFTSVGVEPYGGGLWTTWFDRDLSLAGRAIVKKDDGYQSLLFNLEKPILRIPTLAVHLDRDSSAKLEFNKQTQFLPILSSSSGTKQEKILENAIAKSINVNVDDIKSCEMSLFDSQKAVIGGLNNEFVFSARLDNLGMSFCGLQGFLDACSNKEALAQETNVWVLALFDHEEVGSESSHGAGSPIINDLITRVTNSPEQFQKAIKNSFLVSADMAHCCHPNYSEKHEPNHRVGIHKGPVFKQNANQRYATNAVTGFALKEIARNNQIPYQDFVVRNDSACGSTIGPILAGNTGIRTVDIGNPQLSMHSIRETTGTIDLVHAVNLLSAFYRQFSALDRQLNVD